MFLKQWISILECFLKDHNTLKIGEIDAENSASQEYCELNFILFKLNTVIF